MSVVDDIFEMPVAFGDWVFDMISNFKLSQDILIGVCFHFLGSVLTSLGLVLQKKAHLDMQGSGLPEYKNKMWCIGLFTYCSAQFWTGVSFSFAAQSLLAPLLPITLVANTFFASHYLGEKVTNYDVRAIFMMFFGATMVVIGAPNVEPSGDLETFFWLLFEPLFIGTSLLVFALLAACWAGVKSHDPMFSKIPSILHTLMSGVWSGYACTFFRCAIILLRLWVFTDGANPWVGWQFYVIMVLGGFSGVFLVTHLDRGLESGDATVVVTVNVAFSLVFQGLFGLVFFKEYGYFRSELYMVVFAIGTMFAICSALYPSYMKYLNDPSMFGKSVTLKDAGRSHSSSQAPLCNMERGFSQSDRGVSGGGADSKDSVSHKDMFREKENDDSSFPVAKDLEGCSDFFKHHDVGSPRSFVSIGSPRGVGLSPRAATNSPKVGLSPRSGSTNTGVKRNNKRILRKESNMSEGSKEDVVKLEKIDIESFYTVPSPRSSFEVEGVNSTVTQE